MSRDQILSAEAVDSMIANGDTIVIFEEYVLRLNSWLDRHPGGRLAILHMVGRDATDEITAYHTERTLRTMKAYRIGRKPMGPWTNRTPPIRGGVFQTGTQSDIVPDKSEAQLLALDQEKDFVDEGYGSGISRVASRDMSHRSSPDPELEYATGSQLNLEQPVPRGKAPHLGDDTIKSKKPIRRHKATEPQLALNPEEWTEWAIQQGKVTDGRDFPALESDIQGDIALKYRLLHRRIQDEGLYNCPYIEYGKEMARYTTLFGLFLFTLYHGWFMTSAVFLGLFWHQIMFTAHDAGHRAITTIFAVDTLIGLFIADFCCGLSMGWWKSSHNEHDPDIQNLPLFATCPSFFKSLRSSYYDFTFVWDAAAEFLVPFQKYTYYPVMGIARFNLYLLSWHHVLSAKSSSLGSSKAWWIRPTEIAFMSCYWFIFGYLLLWRTLPTWTIRVAFVLVSHIVTMPLHVQITLSHWGMSTSDLGEDESFPQRQLRTTLDVDCPAWLDFIHGGLQFQAIHHLFPRVPRHNLRKVQVMVREFCADTGIPYSILGFMDGNRKVIGRLEQVSEQVKILVNCQKYMAETGESGLH
ncbi:delta 8-(E)-sphingolipid desaturase [Pochonia chlamydosporia 170]|uniref:Delta 8-(E)-sphingolipid desaturase n=1 Tax=Pochonia chlamydosporia 170 TaxID=1380566 RepID=A0A179G827_METCM|nr:delta 8-(E)-sphingolipid desaturase [Pochonia chlamydosporia 170]OAQ73956.1 delta 8-(E)-sphingolipid desaturase [Pochonia chlamydosporia 170]